MKTGGGPSAPALIHTPVTPVEVSNVSRDAWTAQENHGLLWVSCTIPLNSTLEPVPAVFAYGSPMEKVWPDVSVKLLAVPIVCPVVSTNETLPVHEGVMPLDELGARLTTLI